MPDLRHEVGDDQRPSRVAAPVVAPVVVTGTLVAEFAGLAADAKPFENDQVVSAHFRDGRIEEAWEIADTGSLLRQVGAAGDENLK